MRQFFFESGEVPLINLFLVKKCTKRVSMCDTRGAKSKVTGMCEELFHFWKESFIRLQRKENDEAEQILSNILADKKDTLQNIEQAVGHLPANVERLLAYDIKKNEMEQVKNSR